MQSKLIRKEKRFEIDTEGFRIQMSEIKLWRLIQELISNAFDEESVKIIRCTVEKFGSKRIHVAVEDDGDGFLDYRDIFTLFKDSYKRTNPSKRGRFNLGEKQFFAVAEKGSVVTNKWTVKFKDDTRVIEKRKSSKGTVVNAIFLKPDEESVESITTQLKNLVVPKGKDLYINNDVVSNKLMVRAFRTRLPTSIASGKNSRLVTVKRDTEVILYSKHDDEESIIYELGVPIQTLQDSISWHIDIQQKVPQVTSRNVVSDKYLQLLYSEIAKNTLDLITEDNVGSSWVSDALKKSDTATSRQLLEKMYGTDKVMIESVTDYMANEKAMDNGYALIKGRTLDPDVRKNLTKKTELVKYASKEFGTNFGDAKPVEPNAKMIWYAETVKRIAYDVLKKDIDVEFFSMKESDTIAQAEERILSYNVAKTKKSFFNGFTARGLDILIHELGHIEDNSLCSQQYAHYNKNYLNTVTRIAGEIAFYGIGRWIE